MESEPTEEDKETGNLTVTLNYIEATQAANNAIYMLEKFKDKLDLAAIKKKIINRERRNGDRRKDQS